MALPEKAAPWTSDEPRGSAVRLKICLVGEPEVGKTSLVKRFVLSQFNDSYIRTLGTLVSKKQMELVCGDKRHSVNMIIWDIMGSMTFLDLVRDAYFEGANGILAVCDVTKGETLSALRKWIGAVRSIAGDIPVMILGNKTDLRSEAVVDEGNLIEMCSLVDALYSMTSAKTGENVEKAFIALAQEVVKRIGSRE